MEKHLKRLASLFEQPLFAYATIALLQLKVVWQIWDHKDLTAGDTASYFTDAYVWYERFLVSIPWSPLYTAFYGSLLHITSDVYTVTILHRLIIVFSVTMMVLALMRRLLPPGIAWLIAVWWTILPINFNTLYEVHLFAAIPVLAAALIITYRPHPLARGVAIAILIASSVLVRNELLPSVIALIFICIGWDFWKYRKSEQRFSIKTYLISYGVPTLVAITSICFFYWRSYVKFPELPTIAAPKHTLNVCQIYAFGYQQRYSDWNGDPWTQCMSLMQEKFGKELPTLMDAVKANPSAIIEHFLWNISLSLNGIQLALFNATSGKVNPDYISVNLNAYWVILPTLLLGILIISGLFLLYRERKYWWSFWLRERALSWLLLMPISAVCAFVIIPMQRPRPSYLFGLTIFLMAVAGMSLFVVSHHWRNSRRLSPLLPIACILLLLFTPCYFLQNSSERELLGLYRLLMPYQEILANSKTAFLTGRYSFELCSYLRKTEMCVPLTYGSDTITQLKQRIPLNSLLGAEPIGQNADFKRTDYRNYDEMCAECTQPSANLLFVDEGLLSPLNSNSSPDPFLSQPASFGWQLLAKQNLSPQWMLLQKLDDQAPANNANSSNNVASKISIFPDDLLKGTVKYSGIDQDGWGKAEISVELFQPVGSNSLVVSGLVPLISEPSFTTQLRVQINGQEVASQTLTVGEFRLQIPAPAPGKAHLVTLSFSNQQKLPSPDGRDVTARLNFIGFVNESS